MAIVKSLVAVAWADGRVASEETEVLEALLHAFAASEAEALMVREFAREPKTIDDIPLTEMSADDRRVLLQHAVLLTFSDGDQDDRERAMLGVLAARLRIGDAERDALFSAAAERATRFLNLLS